MITLDYVFSERVMITKRHEVKATFPCTVFESTLDKIVWCVIRYLDLNEMI